MNRRRGRPRRQYRIRVRAERRRSIDHEALARAVLEQAAMDEQARRARQSPSATVTPKPHPSRAEARNDDLA